MKTIIRFASLVSLLALGIEPRGAAQEASQGKVLILNNDGVLEGDIAKVGDQYRIRRGQGETLVAAARVKRVCADWDAALGYLRSQANLGDPDERLRLARWCQQHHLKEQALIEARAAAEMRPAHAETKHLLHKLARPAAPAPAQISQAGGAYLPPDAASTLDVTADCVAVFTTKVQPILMNTCASCHTDGKGGSFQLQRVGDAGTRAATQRNLTTAIRHLKLEAPAASPLLVKAICGHGTSTQPPIRDRKTPAFAALQSWAEQVAANNPHLYEASSGQAPRSSPESAVSLPTRTAPAQPAVAPVVAQSLPRPDAQEPGMTMNAQQALLQQQNPLRTQPGVPRLEIGPQINPRDPFDPASFNQRSTPRR